MAVPFEPELMMSRRAFPKAQELLAGAPLRRLPGLVDVGWHGTDVHPETGACAVLGLGGDQALIGEILKLTYGDRVCFVYVLAVRSVPTPISITRRSMFPTLALLTHESIPCLVEVTQ